MFSLSLSLSLSPSECKTQQIYRDLAHNGGHTGYGTGGECGSAMNPPSPPRPAAAAAQGIRGLGPATEHSPISAAVAR